MSPEQQRIKIAEACGYTNIAPSGRLDGQLVGRHKDIPDSLDIRRNGIEIPNYLSDLNAMHEAEKVLTEDQMERYVQELKNIIGCKYSHPAYSGQACFYVSATATQRAEAFLRTLNLWQDSK